MRRLVVALVAAAGAIFAPAASAHVQVLPASVAPSDPVVFTVLVPNEGGVPTVQVDVKIPDGVIPFSFEETPGWTRSEALAADQSLDVVTWKGSLPPGEFVRFSFIATTPEQEGEIAWPAVQTYQDGTKVRWIGGPGSEEPAATVTVSSDVPKQNAGGEGPGDTSASGETSPAPATTEQAAPAATESDSSRTLEIVAILLGAGGLVAGLAALFVVRRRSG